MESGLIAMPEDVAQPPMARVIIEQSADRATASNGDLRSIHRGTKRLQLDGPLDRGRGGLESCGRQPRSHARVACEDAKQIVSFGNTQIERTGRRSADRATAMHASLPHGIKGAFDQGAGDGGFVGLGNDTQAMDHAAFGGRTGTIVGQAGAEMDQSLRRAIILDGQQKFFGDKEGFAQDALIPKSRRAFRRFDPASVMFGPYSGERGGVRIFKGTQSPHVGSPQDRRDTKTLAIVRGRILQRFLARQRRLHLIGSEHIVQFERVHHRFHSLCVDGGELIDQSDDAGELLR